VPTSLQRTEADDAEEAFPDILAHVQAERYLVHLGVRRARIHLDGETGRIEGDSRDLWRVVAHRDEVLARLADLGLRRVTLDLDARPERDWVSLI
jgi:PP-loop superfamily ATP-utilizing enzyme